MSRTAGCSALIEAKMAAKGELTAAQSGPCSCWARRMAHLIGEAAEALDLAPRP